MWSARPAPWPRVWLVLGPCRCLSPCPSLWPACLQPWPTDGCKLGSPSPRNVALRPCLFYLHAVGSTFPLMFLDFGSQEFPPLRLWRNSHSCLKHSSGLVVWFYKLLTAVGTSRREDQIHSRSVPLVCPLPAPLTPKCVFAPQFEEPFLL